jgi:hypothetical protein
MPVQRMRFAMGVLFLLLAGVIFARAWLMPGLDARFNSLRMNLGGVLALVFAGLNFARWYVVWSHRRAQATPVRTPLQPDASLVQPESPNSELDFTKKSGEPRP